jgi:hypothetical protein
MAGRVDFEARACRDVDPELFFPVAESGPLYEAQVAQAKAVCAGCPIRAQCLAFALERLPYGIAGGMTAGERAAVRRFEVDARARARREYAERVRAGA